MAEDRGYPNSDQETFKIFKMDGSQTWTLLDRYSHLGDYLVSMWGWSMDSRHFYFQYISAAEGGEGKCDLFGVMGSLQVLRFDVLTGQVTHIPLPQGSEHRISPDETLLAYIHTGEPLQLIIRKVQSGAEQTIPLPVYQPPLQAEKVSAGDIHWSPDGHSLILSVANGTLCVGNMTSTLLRVNLEALSMNELIRDDKTLIIALRWPIANRILVENLNGFTWWIDTLTGQMVSAP